MKWNKKMPELLVSEMSTGSSFASACANLGISRMTGYRWKQRYEAWREATELGSTKRLLFLENLALASISEPGSYDARLIIFLLKTHDRDQYG